MDKHEQSWVYRCISPECGLIGVVRDADLRSMEATGPVTCRYSGHKMDRIRKATDKDQKELEPLAPVIREAGGPVILKADPWWPMKNLRVGANRIFFGLGSLPYLSGNILPTCPLPSHVPHSKSEETSQSTGQVDESDVILTLEAASLLKTTESRTTHLARTGVIPAFKVGKKEWRYSRKALQEWVRKQANGCADVPTPLPQPSTTKSFVKPKATKKKSLPTDLSPEALKKAIQSIRPTGE